MLQRIQTLYLLLVVILMSALVFFPLASFTTGETYSELDIFGLKTMDELQPLWALFGLTAIIALLAMVTIFLFRKRMLQIRLCIFNGIMMIAFYALFGFAVYVMLQPETSIGLKLPLSFPLISFIINYLAIRQIGADETLVRAMDRLR